MNAKVETGASAADMLKWLIAAMIIVAGVYGFYYFEDQVLTPIRAVGLLAVIAMAAALAATTTRGRAFVGFMKAANVERQKVVWPTRQETAQTTLVVLVVVVIIGIFIWILDWVFSSLVSWLVG